MNQNMMNKLKFFLHVLYRPRRNMCSSSVIDIFRKKMDSLKDSDELEPEDYGLTIKKSKVTYSLRHYEAVNKYLESNSDLREVKSKIPAHYLVRTFKFLNCLYIVDKKVASIIFEKIQPYIESQKGHIMEVNAGLGVLTEFLLKAHIPRLRIHEGETSLYRELYRRILVHKSEAKLFRANLLMLPTLAYLDRHDNGNRVSSLFEDISPLPWEDDPVVTFIASVPSDKFITYMMSCIIFQNGICSYGRPVMFVSMPSFIYIKFLAKSSDNFHLYRYKAVLFQIMFDCELLLKVPSKAFLPWFKKNPSHLKTSHVLSKSDENNMFVLKLTARRDLLQQIPPHLLKSLWHFVKTMMNKRKAHLITVMERIIPGSGVRLIARGYTIFTQCGSLTPEEYLDLFKEFSSWPEYKTSVFTSDMNESFSKMAYPGLAEEMSVENMKNDKKRARYYDLKEEEGDEEDCDIIDVDRDIFTEDFVDNEEKKK